MITANQNPLLKPPPGMPMLDTGVRAHGLALIEKLLAKIETADNWISFADYMQFCLYDPEFGYYSGGLQKFGPDGDFVTAPEISPLFGQCIATAIAPLLINKPEWSICELGPGRGILADSILQQLNELKALPKSYQLLEVSANLKAQQEQRLKPYQSLCDIKHLNTPPENFHGIVLANEVLDALVVERFHCAGRETYQQCGLSLLKGQLVDAYRPAPAYLVQAIEQLGTTFPENYTSEICVQLKPWLETITQGMESGVLLFSDYGFSQNEYYSPERSQGTIRCHYRQHAHNDFRILPGLQDLTAWVNFTQFGEAALSLGLQVSAYTSQAHFLLGSGHLQNLDLNAMDEKKRYTSSQAIQTLTLPAHMGERFRFMQLNKNCHASIAAMQLRDLRHQL